MGRGLSIVFLVFFVTFGFILAGVSGQAIDNIDNDMLVAGDVPGYVMTMDEFLSNVNQDESTESPLGKLNEGFGLPAFSALSTTCHSSPCTIGSDVDVYYYHQDNYLYSGSCGSSSACNTCYFDEDLNTCSDTRGMYVGCIGIWDIEGVRIGFEGLGGSPSGNLRIFMDDQDWDFIDECHIERLFSDRKEIANYAEASCTGSWEDYITSLIAVSEFGQPDSFLPDEKYSNPNIVCGGSCESDDPEPDKPVWACRCACPILGGPGCSTKSGGEYSFYFDFDDDGWFGSWQIKNTKAYFLRRSDTYSTSEFTFSVPVADIESAELVFDVIGEGDPILPQGELEVHVYYDSRTSKIFDADVIGSATKRIDIINYLSESGVYFDFISEQGSRYELSDIRIEYDLVDCTSGPCCDTATKTFKSSGSQPTGYNDDTDGFCDGTSSPTGTNYAKTRNYYCNGVDAAFHYSDTTVDTCGACQYCTDNDLTCNDYGSSTTCGVKDCDYLDSTCRDYADVNKYCSGSGSCGDPGCSIYANAPEGTYCGSGMECDGYGSCVQECQCNTWTDQECEGFICSSYEMYQTRTCTPSGCASGWKCVYDSSCAEDLECSSDSDCGTSEVCSGDACTLSYYTGIDIKGGGTIYDRAVHDPTDIINKVIVFEHSPSDVTWTSVDIIANVYGINPDYDVEQIHFYTCKGMSPIDCVASETPYSSIGRYHGAYEWSDIYVREGAGAYPQISNFLTLVEVKNADDETMWLGFWDTIKRTNYNFPSPYHLNYYLTNMFSGPRSGIEIFITDAIFSDGVKYFIENFYMLPSNVAFMDKAVFNNIMDRLVDFNGYAVDNLLAIGASDADLDNGLDNFVSQSIDSNEITSVSQKYFFVFPRTSDGKVGNPVTLLFDPICTSIADCGSAEACVNGQCIPGRECDSGPCCNTTTGLFRPSGSQPEDYVDYYYCPDDNSPTGNSRVLLVNYYCNGQDSLFHDSISLANQCGTCEYCSDGNPVCDNYNSSVQCGIWDCDIHDTDCREYDDVNRYCDGYGICIPLPCSWTNEPEGTPCGANGECNGYGDCIEVLLEGDVNSDCVVNIFDLAAVGICYGQAATGNCEDADADGSGEVNIFDMAMVGLNYGQAC